MARFLDPAATAEARRAEKASAVNVAWKLKEVLGHLPGTKYNLCRAAILFDSGMAVEKDGGVALTAEGRRSGRFVETDGRFGGFVELTPEGMAWVADSYLAGKLPMHRKAPGEVGEPLARIVSTWRELRDGALTAAPGRTSPARAA